jgi:hypothetical protein
MMNELDVLLSKAIDAVNGIEHHFANSMGTLQERIDLLKENTEILRKCYDEMMKLDIISKRAEGPEGDNPEMAMSEFEDYVKDFEEMVKGITDKTTEDDLWDVSGHAETLSCDILGQFEDTFNLTYGSY